MSTLAMLRAFWRDPFDPANNIRLFSAIDRHVPIEWWETQPPADPDIAWTLLGHVRKAVERAYPGEGWRWPEEQTFKSLWPTLTPRARWLVLFHDPLHVALEVEQDAAGEYELAVRLLTISDRIFACAGVPAMTAQLHRIYALLALSTLPVGCLRAGLAPVRGVLAGLWLR